MKFTSVRDFKIHATSFLKEKEVVYITRRGKPIAILSPIKEKSPEQAFVAVQRIVHDAGISKKEMLTMLDEVCKTVYSQGSTNL